jgi:hypothetical protein
LGAQLQAAEGARAALQERLQQQQQRAEQLAAGEAAAQGRLAQAECALQQLRVLVEGQAAAAAGRVGTQSAPLLPLSGAPWRHAGAPAAAALCCLQVLLEAAQGLLNSRVLEMLR